ncbi:hypothetical protein JM93_03866 [Roseibium hamelinense]|uniref:Uncharacterized protein n=1 Tax=Roseibium hamelinense TaxID=150831 RepID=A0A562SLR7_9HYPH|nr:hypothetical protein [Roseibium hamelinense]MTI43444.1 hypothetical protein [Roseibium hamelinense]TWI81904.1 hypothetical protein JM93_03866 [Roseibium hamelinense]
MKKFDTDQSLQRTDGSNSFSPRNRSLAETRAKAKDGNVQRIIGKSNTFPDWFKQHIQNDMSWILERPFLKTELKAFKRMLNALSKTNSTECKDLHRRLYENTKSISDRSPLCPIWRHENECELLVTARSRYLFPRVRNELYLVTVIFDFAHNLSQLEDALSKAHQNLKAVVSAMTKKRRGVVMFGTFEPDLVSPQQLHQEPSKAKMVRDFGVQITDSGGWILTGHFVVRAPHVETFQMILNAYFPSFGWERVQIKRIRDRGALEANIMDMLGYAGKYPEPLFNAPSKGPRRDDADRQISALRAAFTGPEFAADRVDASSFNINAAICQWALFIDRMGAKGIHFSVESAYAQKWYSESEMDYIRALDLDICNKRGHRIEMHRDTGPFSSRRPKLKHGRYRLLKSRPMIFDNEWVMETSCTGINLDTEYHDIDSWMIVSTSQ